MFKTVINHLRGSLSPHYI